MGLTAVPVHGPALETSRLILRPLREEDEGPLDALLDEPGVRRYLAGERAADLIAESRKPVAERSRVDLAITLKATGEWVGVCSLVHLEPELGTGELGFALAQRHWGQGYTTEAARVFLTYVFRDLGFRRVWAQCSDGNVGSWHVLEKMGMRREGHLIENQRRDRGWDSTYLYAVLAREWRG